MYVFVAETGGAYACSGVLINPAGLAFTPYMLTAHHCIGTAYEAGNALLLFSYQTSSCNGPPADIDILGSDTGTTYLAGALAEEGDYTLVALRDPAPAGVYLFGWTTNAPKVGTRWWAFIILRAPGHASASERVAPMRLSTSPVALLQPMTTTKCSTSRVSLSRDPQDRLCSTRMEK